MESNQINIVGGATYIGTMLMKSLRAMNADVVGADFHHHNIQRYLPEWAAQNSKVHITTSPSSFTSTRVVITFASDYILKSELPNPINIQKINAYSQVTYPHAQQLIIIMPFNKHDTGLSEQTLITYFGKRDEDIRVMRLAKLYEQWVTNIEKANPNSRITRVYISDVYGHKMPISPNHSLFYSLTHNLPMLRQNLVETYFPTHINDVINGIVKTLFAQEHYDRIALINPQARNYILSMPDHQAHGWYLPNDYTINTSLLAYSKRIFPWVSKHQFNYRRKKSSNVVAAIKQPQRAESSTTNPPFPILHFAQLTFSLIAFLTLCGIPLIKGFSDIKALEQSLSADNLQTSIQTSQSAANNVQRSMWLLTIFQQRERAEALLQSLESIQQTTLQHSAFQALRNEGFTLLSAYLSGKPLSTNLDTWQQKVNLLYADLNSSTTSFADSNPYILGYMTRQNEEDQQIINDMEMANNLLLAATSEANDQFSVEVIGESNKELYHVTNTSKGPILSPDDQPLTTNIQINSALFERLPFTTWLDNLSQRLSSTSATQTIRSLQNAFLRGDIRIIQNNQPCLSQDSAPSKLCIQLNTQAEIKIKQTNDQINLTISNLPDTSKQVTITSSDVLRVINIQDQYLRELETVKTTQLDSNTLIVYQRPEDSSSKIEISWQTSQAYQSAEVYFPMLKSNQAQPTRLLLPLR